jgi:hypothetical protein
MSATFAAAARGLAGSAGAVLGWPPGVFWDATPAELAVVVAALGGRTGAGVAPPGADTIARMREEFPDG